MEPTMAKMNYMYLFIPQFEVELEPIKEPVEESPELTFRAAMEAHINLLVASRVQKVLEKQAQEAHQASA
jgi:hypothetical protein